MQRLNTLIDVSLFYIKQNKSWMWVSAVVFFGGTILLGGLTAMFPQEVEELYQAYFQELEHIGEQIFTAEPLIGTVLLFWNNFTTALLMMISGVFIGIPTFFILLINGGALGVLATILSIEGVNPLPFYLFGVLPHGIFEIPAILIAGGIGLKIGGQIIWPSVGKTRGHTLKDNFKLGIRLLPAVFGLLVIAALIEILITPVLLNMVAEVQI